MSEDNPDETEHEGEPAKVAGQAASGPALGQVAKQASATLGAAAASSGAAAVASALGSAGLPPEVASAGLGLAQQTLGEALDRFGAVKAGQQALAKVNYTFTLGDGSDTHWMVRRMRFEEALSEPYWINLELVSEDLGADTEGLLGANVELTFDRQGDRQDLVRTVCGIVHVVEFIGVVDDRLQIRVEVVPALDLLAQRVDTRLWQNAKVPDVVREVLETAFADYERQLELGNLRASYPEREYIVQYHESDLDFVHRLLEEEGITYWFDHERGEGKELLVLEDSADNYVDLATIDDESELRIIVDRADNAEVESIQALDWTRELTPSAVHQRVFDWLSPREPLEASAPAPGQRDTDDRGRKREIYHHGRFVEADPGPRTIRKLEHRKQRDKLARGVGNVTGMTPGRKFALVDHQRPDLDQQYLLRQVIHFADCPEVMQGQPAADGARYQNHFECQVLDAAKPFRPAPRTPKPKIFGPQTAIVTGPEGEEIHTDEHGRIKVRFDWDRVHTLTDDTSMWIRVAHHWAGPGFGTFFLPRIGMEVVVEFLEGDPAKPLVSGCVYNGDNQTSVAVPGSKTRSTIRTKSSPASEGYNELRFEDAAGSEEIFVHAQKDYNETVEHDHRTTVHGKQSNHVDGSQTNSVGGDQSESISHDATLTIDENRTVTIKGSQAVTILGERANAGISGSRLTITGDYELDASNTIEIQAPTHIKLVCGGSSITLTPNKIEIRAGGKASLVLDADALMESALASQVKLDADAATTASTGASLTLNDQALLAGKAGAIVALSGDALMASSASSQVRLDAAAQVIGSASASVQGPTATLAGEGGTVEASPTGVAVSGTEIEVAATGVTAISGATVKLN